MNPEGQRTVREIEVACTKGHPRRTVVRFYFNDLTKTWAAHPPASKTKTSGLVYLNKAVPWVYLYKNAPLTLRQIGQLVKSGRAGGIKRGYKLSCPKCKDNVRRSAEEINPALDTLTSDGLSVVELSDLDAILAKRNK